MDRKKRLLRIGETLERFFGDLHWWPGETPFEVAVGAILTQNTNWANVEKAIGRLKAQGVLDPGALRGLDDETLADLIRPSGYFRVKAKRLKAFLDVLCGDFGGDLEQMLSGDLLQARQRLLGISGIGEETADSILLYAGGRPVFVIDAYTRRILARHGVIDGKPAYGELQRLFMTCLPRDAGLYNQYHALIVETGKRYCRKEPRCEACPLRGIAGRDGGGKAGKAATEPAVRRRGRATCSSGKKSSRRDSRKSGTPLS
ncbi:MAG: endonuclease III domain-containing protein [Syntrophaceae bacterium]